MHEEATSISSVPSSVAASTVSVEQQNENGTSMTTNTMVNNEEVELEVSQDNDNGDLQVPFTTNSEGNHFNNSLISMFKNLQVRSFRIVILRYQSRLDCVPQTCFLCGADRIKFSFAISSFIYT